MYIKLFESYQSQKELEYLTKLLIDNSTEAIIEKIEHKWTNLKELPIIKMNVNPTIFNQLENFLKNFFRFPINSVVEEIFKKSSGSI